MRTKVGKWVLAAGVAALLSGSVVLADGHSGGGHSFGGGGHSSGGGGGHVGGGYVSGGHAFTGGHSGGVHFGGAAHGYGAPAYGAHGAYNTHWAGNGGGHPAYAGGYGHGAGNNWHGGEWHGGGWRGGDWHGGYWHGGYWPRAYYGWGFSWFLPVLPLAYATYWYSGIPYYYANDVYYTWSPSYEGYVATDPPPAASQGAIEGDVGQVFMYPKNGQSQEQTSVDKRECQQWASSQMAQGGSSAAEFRRAMIACVEGRGYSAK